MFGNKKFKTNSVFDLSLNPVPDNIKRSLDLVGRSFCNSRLRNLDILYNHDNNSKLYGLMTNYEGQNYCWIQPTRAKSITPDHEYNQYICKVNNRSTSLIPLADIKIGMDCLALYEADGHWYRAVTVAEVEDRKWQVLFIDYGNFQVCTPVQLREIYSDPRCDHFHAPMQALCCRLYNIVPTMPKYREDIDIYMERFFTVHSTTFLELIVKNIRQDYVIDCDVFLPKSKLSGPGRLHRRHVGQVLVDEGLASFVDPEAAYAIKLKLDPENVGPQVVVPQVAKQEVVKSEVVKPEIVEPEIIELD